MNVDAADMYYFHKERLYIFIALKIVGYGRSVGDSVEHFRINHFLKLFFREAFEIFDCTSVPFDNNTKKRFWTILALK